MKENKAYKKCEVDLKTNTLKVDINIDTFMDKYTIISYSNSSKDKKALSYERFLNQNYEAVFGHYGSWPDGNRYTRFFVLAQRKNAKDILECLDRVDTVSYKEDDMSDYDEHTKEFIITALAINSLHNDYMHTHSEFCNGKLTVWDDDNFTIKMSKDRRAIVGLDIELTKYMNLVARTKSFKRVRNIEYVKQHWDDNKHRLFKQVVTKDGHYRIVPFSLKNFDKADKEKDLYEVGSFKRNVVPFWPFSTQDYQSGKLVVLWNIVKQLNEKYKGMIQAIFTDYPNMVLEQSKTEKESLDFIDKVLSGKIVCVEDTVRTEQSQSYLKRMIDEMNFYHPEIQLKTDTGLFDCKIQLLKGMEDDVYTKGEELAKQQYVTQHHIFLSADDEGKEKKRKEGAKTENACLKRLLLELAVKYQSYVQTIPVQLADQATGWSYYMFKQVKGATSDKDILGSKMTLKDQGVLNFEDFKGEKTFEKFVKHQIGYREQYRLDSRKVYRILEKDGNQYLIVDTEETPMMDVDSIDDAYNQIEYEDTLYENVGVCCEDAGFPPEIKENVKKYIEENDFVSDEKIKLKDLSTVYDVIIKPWYKAKDEKPKNPFTSLRRGKAIISIFKRKDVREKYLGGYQGIHVWDIKDFQGKYGAAFSYMVGTNSENIQITERTVFDKVPHSHYVQPLKIEKPDNLESDRKEILSMLSHGFGRWNEAMSYPFPYKFLSEHIERMTLQNFGQHWETIKTIE